MSIPRDAIRILPVLNQERLSERTVLLNGRLQKCKTSEKLVNNYCSVSGRGSAQHKRKNKTTGMDLESYITWLVLKPFQSFCLWEIPEGLVRGAVPHLCDMISVCSIDCSNCLLTKHVSGHLYAQKRNMPVGCHNDKTRLVEKHNELTQTSPYKLMHFCNKIAAKQQNDDSISCE